MTTSLYSPSWYRVAGLKPRLRGHVEIHRHFYRGDLWYILQDHASGRFQRFTPSAYLLIGLMDGERRVQEIWDEGRARLGEDAPTQDEMIRLLSQLYSVDAVQCDASPDTSEMLKRFEKGQSSKWKQNIRSPLAMRFSLFDPERFLTRFRGVGKFVFSWLGALVWLAVMSAGIVMAGIHWPELTENIADRVLVPKNLLLMWLTFPFLKAFHEFGHAFAVKKLGGEVHEIGIMFLVLTPVPYVDASSASAFRSKWQRMLVGAAGMIIELFIAALALFVWIYTEPGTFRAVLYNIIFIAGVSSVLFNGNPLLRYDAYYILVDFLEIPNLGPRGLQYLGYLIQRRLFRVHEAEPPLSTAGERVWFVLYSVASFIYRIIIYIGIIFFIAGKMFVAGVILAAWAVISMVIRPAVKGAKFLFSSPRLGRKRTGAIAVTGVAAAAIAAIIFLAPLPLNTLAEGVVWVPEQCFVRAGTEGYVERLIATPGSKVKEGDPLVECYEPFLPVRIRVLESRINELKALYDSQILTNRVEAEMTNDEMKSAVGELEDAQKRAADLIVRSSVDGAFFCPLAQDLPGRFVKRGELLGYVLERSFITARTVVQQADVDLVRKRTVAVQIRLPEKISDSVPARIEREIPAVTDQLPSQTLSQEGGGQIAIDPRDSRGVTAFQKIFLFDIRIPEYSGRYNVGGRVYVRFDHGTEPLFRRWYRNVRQLFLRRFNV